MHNRTSRLALRTLFVLASVGCGGTAASTTPVTPKTPEAPVAERARARADATHLLPPLLAYQRDLMPLAPTGVPYFRQAHPEWDGRGVLIAILDSGIDPNVDGLRTTTTGAPKLADLRDFSGEGRIALTKVTPNGDAVVVAGKTLRGFGRLRGVNRTGPWYAGTVREIALGEVPASDLNWNNVVGDTVPVLVTKATDGWVLLADLDGDGTLSDERPVHDYLVARESFGWAPSGHTPGVGVVANFAEQGGEPVLDLYFDISGHGTHVAGIAAGNGIFGISGFDGVAPGAELLGLKIANDAQGGISTSGSMRAALDYAIRMAAQHRKPLVVNMSFGVGNEQEGAAVIDRIIDSVLVAHPDVVFTISAGNDGPGLSTVGFPGSARRIISVGATFPRSFLMADPGPGVDPIAYFSARGGELARPDLLTPGVAFSTVPRWNQGDEVKQGTSMASPHAAGLAALLVSALTQTGKPVEALRLRQALVTTAQPIDGLTMVDQGTGVPNVARAWAWLAKAPTWTQLNASAGEAAMQASFRGNGIVGGDSTETWRLVWDAPVTFPARVTFRSDAPWLTAPRDLTFDRQESRVTTRLAASRLRTPGTYVGTVTVWGADTLAGPVARLVHTVVVPYPAGTEVAVPVTPLGPGAVRRFAFGSTAGRPFEIQVGSASPNELVRGYLHEPGGQPFRGGAEVEGSSGPSAARIRLDASDVLGGVYEAVAVAPPADGSSAGFHLLYAPITMIGDIARGLPMIGVRNVSDRPVTLTLWGEVIGAAREVIVDGVGSDTGVVPVELPEWVKRLEVDVELGPGEWPKFTDFGVTLEDADGRQMQTSPLNASFWRMEATLPLRRDARPARVLLFPGWAAPTPGQRYSAVVRIRLYGAPTDVATMTVQGSPTLSLAPGAVEGVRFAVPSTGIRPEPGYVPLLRYHAESGGVEGWTLVTPMAPAPTPMMR